MIQDTNFEPCWCPNHFCFFHIPTAVFSSWACLLQTGLFLYVILYPESLSLHVSKTSTQLRSRDLCLILGITSIICQFPQLWIAYINLSLINYSSVNDCHIWLRRYFIWLNLHTTELTSSSTFSSIVQHAWDLSLQTVRPNSPAESIIT